MRARWIGVLLVVASCAPWRCDRDGADEEDLAAGAAFDFAVGELGRTLGNECTTVDNCNQYVADRCEGRCQCGEEGLACCGGRCVDLATDKDNCGGCGIGCGGGSGVQGAGTSGSHCSCDVDAGGCGSAFEPSCNGEGLCTCGGSSNGVCNSLNA